MKKTSTTKYIFVTGGVLSSVGKGIVASSIGRILQECGLKIGVQKLDPYINVDPGTMSPYQHGEVFVTEDGAETDLDLGHYERFLDINLKRSCNVTAGQVYAHVVARERKGDFLGGTIQVIPHVTQTIKWFVVRAAQELACDILIVEVGGTVGDIEVLPFLEAIRQMPLDIGLHNTFFTHVAWLPYVKATQELKTKPSQHSLRELRSVGIVPDLVVARSDYPVDPLLCDKLALFANLAPHQVISLETYDNMYAVPLYLKQCNLADLIMQRLKLKKKLLKFSSCTWMRVVKRFSQPARTCITVGLVGKYVGLHDAYISVRESLIHAARERSVEVLIKWIDAEQLNKDNVSMILSECDGIVIPGGFGKRGVEGKIYAARCARINKKPYLGLCLGMQVVCIDLARTFIDIKAHSVEFDPKTSTPVIALMDSQRLVTNKGGTMRLGLYPCVLKQGTKSFLCYKKRTHVQERHRHRFEFNMVYANKLEMAGLIISGVSPDGKLVELIELKKHPFMVACQFHPEFLSRPATPHPLFVGLISAIVQQKQA